MSQIILTPENDKSVILVPAAYADEMFIWMQRNHSSKRRPPFRPPEMKEEDYRLLGSELILSESSQVVAQLVNEWLAEKEMESMIHEDEGVAGTLWYLDDEKATKLLDVVVPAEQNIPNDGSKRMKRTAVRVRQQGIWDVHKNDADKVFPSDFHADRQDAPEKLDLYTGDIFNRRTHQRIRSLSRKTMRYLYNRLSESKEPEIQTKLAQKAKFIYLDLKDAIEALLKVHKQNHTWSCSASAHEFIAKLHGKIANVDFPLQNSPSSSKAGFQFESFLNSIGFTAQDSHLRPQETLNALGKETAANRFPLVSILAGLGSSQSFWHIVVAVPLGSEVALVDPSKQDFLTRSSDETLKLLQSVSAADQSRLDIHFLTYRETTTSKSN